MILDGVGTFRASRGDREWPEVLHSACSQPEGTGACWSAQRREIERGWVYLISSHLPRRANVTPALLVASCRTLRQLSSKSWKWKRTLGSKGTGCSRGIRQFYFCTAPPWNINKRATKLSLHLLILQSGSCEFGANDSGWWSSELKMEMGCGPNRAWSILSSSPGLLTHTGVGPAGTPFCVFPGCIPRHCRGGGSKCLMGTKSTPSLVHHHLLSSVQLWFWPWQKKKRASGRSHRAALVITTNQPLNGASKMCLNWRVETGPGLRFVVLPTECQTCWVIKGLRHII